VLQVLANKSMSNQTLNYESLLVLPTIAS